MHLRRCRGSNPGHPRDRREYLPLYYNDIDEQMFNDGFTKLIYRVKWSCDPRVLIDFRGFDPKSKYATNLCTKVPVIHKLKILGFLKLKNPTNFCTRVAIIWHIWVVEVAGHSRTTFQLELGFRKANTQDCGREVT